MPRSKKWYRLLPAIKKNSGKPWSHSHNHESIEDTLVCPQEQFKKLTEISQSEKENEEGGLKMNMDPMDVISRWFIETGARGERAFGHLSLLLRERIIFLGTPNQ